MLLLSLTDFEENQSCNENNGNACSCNNSQNYSMVFFFELLSFLHSLINRVNKIGYIIFAKELDKTLLFLNESFDCSAFLIINDLLYNKIYLVKVSFNFLKKSVSVNKLNSLHKTLLELLLILI